MRTLELDQQRNGQWRYRVLETIDNKTITLVDWEWGLVSENETIKQAQERFGQFDKIIIQDWI